MNQKESTEPKNCTEVTRYSPCVPKTHRRGSNNSKYDSSSSSETDVKVAKKKSTKEGDEHCLSKAIQAYAKQLSEDLPFTESELADTVVNKECVTEDECKRIREIKDRKDQVRAIILIIKTRSYKIMEMFLDAAKVHCPSVVEAIWKRYNQNIRENRGSIKRPCWLCNLKRSVDVKRVVDVLWSEDILDDAVVREINSCKMVVGRQDKYWEKILKDCLKDNRIGLNILCGALETNGHYTHIARNLRTFLRQNDQILSCMCSIPNDTYSKLRASSINSEPADSDAESVVPAESLCSELESTYAMDNLDSDLESTFHAVSLHSEEEMKDIDLDFKADDGEKRVDIGKLATEDTASTAPDDQCNNNAHLGSRNRFDPPRQRQPIQRRNKRQRQRQRDTPWWKRFVFFCGPNSFTTLDEAEEEEDKPDERNN